MNIKWVLNYLQYHVNLPSLYFKVNLWNSFGRYRSGLPFWIQFTAPLPTLDGSKTWSKNKVSRSCCCFSTGTLQGDECSRTKYVQDAYKKLTCMLLSMVFERPWCPIFCSYWSQWMQKLKWLCHWHHFRYQYKLKSTRWIGKAADPFSKVCTTI